MELVLIIFYPEPHAILPQTTFLPVTDNAARMLFLPLVDFPFLFGRIFAYFSLNSQSLRQNRRRQKQKALWTTTTLNKKRKLSSSDWNNDASTKR